MSKFFRNYVSEFVLSFVLLISFVMIYLFVSYGYYNSIKKRLYKSAIFVENEFIPHLEFDGKDYLSKIFKHDLFDFLEIEVKKNLKYELIYKSRTLHKHSLSNTYEDMQYKEISIPCKFSYKKYILFTKHTFLNSHDYVIRLAFSLENYNSFLINLASFLFILYLVVLVFIFFIFKKFKSISRLYLKNMEKVLKKVNQGEFSKRLDEKVDYPFKSVSKEINFLISSFENKIKRTKYITSKISHELNTPITIIRGEIEVTLLNNRSLDEYKDTMKSILEEIYSLQLSIDNMLFLSQLSNEKLEHHMSCIHLNDILEEVINLNQIQLESKSINIIFDNASSSVIYGEFVLLKHMLNNIVNNAIKYSSHGSNIYINIENKTDTIKLIIKDEGFGIDKNSLEDIFKPFFRSKNIKNTFDIEGMGIGLYLVKMISDLHDINVVVKSSIDKGTIFELYFKLEKIRHVK